MQVTPVGIVALTARALELLLDFLLSEISQAAEQGAPRYSLSISSCPACRTPMAAPAFLSFVL